VKKEECRVFLEYFYFKLKEEYSEGILEFDSDKEIKVGKTGTVFDKGLKFVEHLHEI